MQVAQRHFNAHAFVNMAAFLDVQQAGSNGHMGLQVKQAHVVYGFSQQKGDMSSGFCLCVPACILALTVDTTCAHGRL